VTVYWLDDRSLIPGRGRNNTSRQALAGTWNWPFASIYRRVWGFMELCLHSPISFHEAAQGHLNLQTVKNN